MNNPILGCWWVVNAESLENKGIPRFSFRFESTSAHQNLSAVGALAKVKVSCYAPMWIKAVLVSTYGKMEIVENQSIKAKWLI